MRVALFTETFLPKVDGIVTVVCLLLDHLARRGVESVIVAPKLDKLGTVPRAYADTRVIAIDGLTLPLYPELKVGPPGFNTYNQLKAFQPDVAHFIHPVLIGTTGLLMAKRLGIPTLASFHLDLAQMAHHYHLGLFEPVVNKFTQVVFNAADYSLAPSKRVQREMTQIGVKRVGLWGRGVDAERFNPRYYSEAMRHEMSDGNPDAPLLIYVGRLSSEKRLDCLRPMIEALPEARLVLVGDGPEREALQKRFAGTNTKFMGYMTGEPLSQAYASADVFVFPSALETFGLVVVEAMAAGLPVVASRVGGIPDVVEEGKTGYTFEVDDVAALTEGVRKVIASRERIKQMGRDARTFAETKSWPAMMDEVIEVYERLIAEKSRIGALAS
ncbi:MAG: glycosyltransferase family 1 protein [bacterium]|nr:glycosyltransferase family 1 protein [bacterium]